MTDLSEARRPNSSYLQIPALLFTSLLTSLSHATPSPLTEADLVRMATEPGEVTSVTSTEQDPVGEAGLWGMVAHMIVPHGCEESFHVLKDIERYPQRIKKVKRVEVLKRLPNGLLTSYTESEMGFSNTATMLFTFLPKTLTILSEAVGDTDRVTWSQTRFVNVGPYKYCRVEFSAFADASWVPDFILDWGMSMAADKMASIYRDVLHNVLHSPEGPSKQKPE